MTLPIRVRLTASYLAVMVALLATITVAVPVRLSHDLASQADQSLRQPAEQLLADYAREGDTEFVEDANAATGGCWAASRGRSCLLPTALWSRPVATVCRSSRRSART